MSKQPWWGARLWTWLWQVGMPPIPKVPPRPSAAGIARAAGWVRAEGGLWRHPVLGEVEETHGKWSANGAGRFPTMLAAMDHAVKQADGTDTDTPEMGRALPVGFIADCENCEAPIMEGERYRRWADDVLTCETCSDALANVEAENTRRGLPGRLVSGGDAAAAQDGERGADIEDMMDADDQRAADYGEGGLMMSPPPGPPAQPRPEKNGYPRMFG